MLNLSFIRHVQSASIKLLILVNFISEGTNLSEKDFSNDSFALTQTMFNFCFNSDLKSRSLKNKRYDHSKKTTFTLYVAIKIKGMVAQRLSSTGSISVPLS